MLDLSISDFSVLGFGGLFCLVWAAGLSLQLPIRSKFIAVYFVGISGFRLVWEAFTLSGFVYRYPEIYSLPVPFLYLIGHSILFYYEKLSGVENWKMSYSHFIPVVIAFLPLFYWIGLRCLYSLDYKSQNFHSSLYFIYRFQAIRRRSISNSIAS